MQGILLKNHLKIPKKFIAFKKDLSKIENFSKKKNISKLQLCLNFVLLNKNISKIVVGIENKNNLESLLKLNLSSKIKKIPNFKIKNPKLIDPRTWKSL